ncbi:hypothetical protein ACFWZW_05820 [Microbacterium enclense]|uniref:hypothetical protein n=1 Tax=Microbacterium enclense TaxID=993073 RepID=UPI0036D9ABCC
MSARLLFPDPQAAADLLTFSSRAVRLGDGTVRVRAQGGVLVTTSAPLAPRGLLDATPTVLGLRVSAIDPELECDLVVEASGLLPAPDDASAVVLPATATSPAWAGVSPPRAGWEKVDAVDAAVLAQRAQYGVAAVADALPADAGEDVVRAVRARVWGEADEALGGLPLGTAFAAFALGFIAGAEEAVVRRSGAWTRVTLQRGHVLVRGPVRSGLTAVRATGTA